MALIEVSNPLRVGYDPDTNELVMVFERHVPSDADFVADKQYEVRLPIASTKSKDLSKVRGDNG